MFRPANSVLMGLAVVASEWVAERGLPPVVRALAGFYVAFSLTAGVMIVNDYFDREVDRINRPDRPLPSGLVSSRLALSTAAGLFITGLLVSAIGPWSVLAFSLAALSFVVSMAYDAKLKASGLLGNAIVSYNVALPFLYGSVMIGKLMPINILFFGYAFAANMAREVIKGVPDLEGDRARGIKTVAVTWGERAAAKLGALLMVADVAASPLPFFMGYAGLPYLVVLAVGDVLLLHSTFYALFGRGARSAWRGKNEMLLGMAVVVLAFFVSPLRGSPAGRRKG